MTRFLPVCLGGALGSGARYLIALGVVMELMSPTDLRLFLTMGILGGFTTYSSFNQEALQLLREQAWGMALLYMTATSSDASQRDSPGWWWRGGTPGCCYHESEGRIAICELRNRTS